jgi:hypothetical protein
VNATTTTRLNLSEPRRAPHHHLDHVDHHHDCASDILPVSTFIDIDQYLNGWLILRLQSYPPQILLGEPTEDDQAVPTLQLHIWHQGYTARRRPVSHRAAQATRRTL